MAYEDKDGKLFPKLAETHNKDTGKIKRGNARLVKVSETIRGNMSKFKRTEQPLRKLEDTEQWLVEETSCKRHRERIIY